MSVMGMAVGVGQGDGEWRVAESGVVDRIDRLMGSIFGLGRKSPPEKFFDDGERRRFLRWVEAEMVSPEVESEKGRRPLLHWMYDTLNVSTDGRKEDFFPRNGVWCWATQNKRAESESIRLSVFPISLAGVASEWFKKDCNGSVNTLENLVEKFIQKFYQLSDDHEDDDPDDIAEIFKIEENLFDYETPLYKAFNEFNYLLKINTDLFTFEIQEIKTYEEYELNNNMTEELEEPWSKNRVPHQLCDHICEPYHFKNGKTKWPTCSSNIDGFCNGGELPGMVRVGCMTYFQDHKWYYEMTDGKLKEEALMHKARFEESWGDATPGVMKFCAWLKSSFENFHELDYDVLVKLEECWNYGASNTGNTQDNKKEHHDPSICNIRRFEMMKYSFDADDEYVAIKEREHSDHSGTNIDAC
ncbi:hypothetical protein Tco_1292689 [Tanacetum coccineum]